MDPSQVSIKTTGMLSVKSYSRFSNCLLSANVYFNLVLHQCLGTRLTAHVHLSVAIEVILYSKTVFGNVACVRCTEGSPIRSCPFFGR